MPEKEEYVSVCPKCGSPNIETDFSQPANIMGGIYPSKCNNCNYVGKIFPEINIKDLKQPLPKKEVKNVQLVSQEYGKGYMGALKILGPIGILIGLVFLTASLIAGLLLIVAMSFLTYLAFKKNKAKPKAHNSP